MIKKYAREMIRGMSLVTKHPKSHYLLSSEAGRAGTYQLQNENGNTFLRLGSGVAIYVEQIVSIEPHRNYVLKMNGRVGRRDENIAASLCEKWLLTSFNCLRISVSGSDADGGWRIVEAPFAAGSKGDNPWYASKSLKFALHNPPGRFHIDIDNVRLETIRGENLLRNGDFSEALDHWFFSADNHLQWHAKSLPVAVLFDQGWFDLLAVGLFSILAIKRATGRAWGVNLHAAAALASFSRFLVVGLFDTLIDVPRFLFLLLGGLCGYRNLTAMKGQHNG